MKSKQERFDELAYKYGCGYWNVCWEHACPCNVSVTCDGVYSEERNKSKLQEARRVVDLFEKEGLFEEEV